MFYVWRIEDELAPGKVEMDTKVERHSVTTRLCLYTAAVEYTGPNCYCDIPFCSRCTRAKIGKEPVDVTKLPQKGWIDAVVSVSVNWGSGSEFVPVRVSYDAPIRVEPEPVWAMGSLEYA